MVPVLVIASSIGIVHFLKYNVFGGVMRPNGGTGSFPSSHASTATTTYLMLYYYLSGYVGRRIKIGIAGSLIGLISISRVVLGKHRIIDLIAGIYLVLVLYGWFNNKIFFRLKKITLL